MPAFAKSRLMEDNLKRVDDWFLNGRVRDQVRGYLQDTQARALYALLGHQARMGLTGSLAEIGVYLGKTLIGIARAAGDDEHVLGVDPLVIDNHDLAPELNNNLSAHLNSEELSRVSVKRTLSTQLDVLEWMESLKQAARFIHLDGYHAREAILHDLQLASCWLQKGAVVVIDDFLNELHPDLTSGILDGLRAHPQLELVAVIPRMGHIEEGGSKLVCATRGDGAMYRDALDRGLADHLRPWSDRMFGREVRVYRSSAPRKTFALPQPKQFTDALPVVFALEDLDGFYWLNTAVAMTSVAQHAKQPVEIYVLHEESLEALVKQRLREIADDMQVRLTLMPTRLPDSIDIARLRQFGIASLFKLLVPKIFADRDLVVYLDSDLVANGLDITELATAASPDAAVSAVRDPYIAIPTSHASQLQRLGLDAASYVNTGVLVFRPELLQDDLMQAFVEFSEANPNAIHPDQDFLNLYFQGRLHFLNEKFNYQVSGFQHSMIKPLSHYQGKILHYAGRVKPLDGCIAPGLMPFWMHAHRVPEITQGLRCTLTRYLTYAKHDPNALKWQQIGPLVDQPERFADADRSKNPNGIIQLDFTGTNLENKS